MGIWEVLLGCIALLWAVFGIVYLTMPVPKSNSE